MKSMFLLCEYKIPPVLVLKLDKKGYTIEKLYSEICKNGSIKGLSNKKTNRIKRAIEDINMEKKEESIYILLKYGLSKNIIDSLFREKIDLDKINIGMCDIFNGGHSTYYKIIRAYDKYKKAIKLERKIKKKLNSSILKSIIQSSFEHNPFNINSLLKILKKQNFENNDLEYFLKNINLFCENGNYILPYDINDLKKYGISKELFNLLKDNNLKLEDINDNLIYKIKITDYQLNKLLKIYKNFKKNNPLYKPNLSIDDFINFLIEKFGHESFTYNDMINIIPISDYVCFNYNTMIEKALAENKISLNDNIYTINFPLLKYKIEKITKKNNHYDIVIKKLQGYTLEEIGNDYNLTRERIRQIFTKELAKLQNVYEDKYAKIFTEYSFDKRSFCKIFNEPSTTYYFLKEKYKNGNKDTYELIKKDYLTDEQKQLIRKVNNLFEYNGEDVLVNKISILIAYLKKRDSQVEYNELMQAYNNIIDDYKLNLKKLTEADARNVDSILTRSPYIINSYGKTYRYYNFEDIDQENLDELKDLFSIEPGVYSAELFFNDNKMLMKKNDIRDEYELHNLLRKALGNFDKNITFSRMPDIHIYCDDKKTFIEEKIIELAPINLDEFCDYIYQNYGHKANTLKSYIVTYFAKYINTKKYKSFLMCDCPMFSIEEFNFMKNYLREDVYSITTIKDLLTFNFNVKDFKLINSINFEKLGYKIRGNYIMKNNITNLEMYLRKNILNTDYYYIKPEMKKIGSTFTSYLYKFIYDKLIFKVGEDKYITISGLNKKGITINDINNFIKNITNSIEDNKYFNLYTLNINFQNNLFDLNFPNCFYETIIMSINNVKTFKVKNNILFIKTSESATKEKFINSFIIKDKTYINEIKEIIKQQFNIEFQESYIKEFINRNKFYLQSSTNCVYLNRNIYENEINKWDILKYLN